MPEAAELRNRRWNGAYQVLGTREEVKFSEMKLKSLSHVQLFATTWTVVCQAPLSMGFSKQDTGVGCRSLLQGIFPTQGLKPGLLHCRQSLYHLSHQGSPEERKVDCYSMGIVSILQDEKFLEICCTIVYTTVHLKMVKMVISETCFLP